MPKIHDLTQYAQDSGDPAETPEARLRTEIARAKEQYNEEVEHLEYYRSQVQATKDRMFTLLGRISQYEAALEVIKNVAT